MLPAGCHAAAPCYRQPARRSPLPGWIDICPLSACHHGVLPTRPVPGGRHGPLLVLATSELGAGHRARHVGCGVCVPPPAHILTARRQAIGVRRRTFPPSVAPSLAKPRGTRLLRRQVGTSSHLVDIRIGDRPYNHIICALISYLSVCLSLVEIR
jgi:hypothetical protein